MEKLIFEGTPEQIKNLLLLIEHGDNNLPQLKDNYQTENLWSVEDVRANYECTRDEAHEVLEEALQNEATMNQIWFAVRYHAEEMGLEEKEYQLKVRL